MGDMGDFYRDWNEDKKRRKAKNLEQADSALRGAEGWKVHTDHHWQYTLNGDLLDYWPSTNKWRWRNKTHNGNVNNLLAFIKKQERRGK